MSDTILFPTNAIYKLTPRRRDNFRHIPDCRNKRPFQSSFPPVLVDDLKDRYLKADLVAPVE